MLTLSQTVFTQFVDQRSEQQETPPLPTSNVPFRQNPDFVDRATLTEQIHTKLSDSGRAALVGLGGVG